MESLCQPRTFVIYQIPIDVSLNIIATRIFPCRTVVDQPHLRFYAARPVRLRLVHEATTWNLTDVCSLILEFRAWLDGARIGLLLVAHIGTSRS